MLQVVYERSRAGLTRYRDEVEASFSRSVMCALAAVEIGRARGQVFADAYLCGLLHDIGEGRVYRVLAEIPGEQPKEVVRRLVDRHHVRAGAEVARAWGLPEAVIDACENHHKEARHVSPRVRVIMAADLLAAAALCASEAGRSAPTFTPEQEGLLKMLDLSPKQASTILQGVFVAGRLSR